MDRSGWWWLTCTGSSSGRGRVGGADRRGEPADPVGQLVDGVVERGLVTAARRVGDRPVQPVRAGAEFLVGGVADGDDDVVGPQDVLHVPWSGRREGEPVAGGGR